MIYLYWKNLELHEANALQFALIKGMISPVTLLGWACNIKHQLSSIATVDIQESASIIIYDCRSMQERSAFRSYVPGDSHVLKNRLTTTPRQYLSIDLILRLETNQESALQDLLKDKQAQYLLQNMTLAKSHCFSPTDSNPLILNSIETLYDVLLTRPVSGFLPLSLSSEHWPEIASEPDSDSDALDVFINLLCDSHEYENIHNISSFFPLVMGLRLLESPHTRLNVRENYHHAFAEPLIGLAQPLYLFQLSQEQLEKSFWHYQWQDRDYLAVNNSFTEQLS
ncbi:hypothetical protein EOPP23_14915 [Endozoicomonas sp. OPT23]|uniref:hypothetical protein n=1 Tax=Endozoicomonas sp. OPT23 TaxID=2072845 RepID=UPI00129B399D|nr:hypothetical protein [Endozoicomonas sp. OPT23]MRI34279.1 hypothetical protein [Endozoicomonas sp. OPT23]